MSYNSYGREDYKRKKNERTRRAREQFMILVLLLALIPTILSIILFAKQAQLQKSVAELERQVENMNKGTDSGANSGIGGAKDGEYLASNVTGGAVPPAGSPSAAPPSPGATMSPEATLTPGPTPTDIPDPTPTDIPAPTPTDIPDPTPTDVPTPTIAVDPETGEPLPWSNKKIYLTFDDGPSKNTDALLDLLAQYDIRVTFFVIGKSDEESLRLYQRIVDEGHTLGMHSYSHDYADIYKSVENFEADFTKISDLLYNTVGFVPDLYRFPGGSSNSKCKALTIQPFISFLQERDIRYFDWNVENGDATGKAYTIEELAQNLIDGVSNKETSVVLCHDTAAKGNTLESMKIVLPYLIERGAQVLPITSDTPLVRHVKPADEM